MRLPCSASSTATGRNSTSCPTAPWSRSSSCARPACAPTACTRRPEDRLLHQLLELAPTAGVGDVGGGEPGAACGGDGVVHVVQGLDAMGVGVEHDRDAGF